MESNENYYNLRNESAFRQSLIRTVYHGKEIISYFGRKVWDTIRGILQEASPNGIFKNSVRK